MLYSDIVDLGRNSIINEFGCSPDFQSGLLTIFRVFYLATDLIYTLLHLFSLFGLGRRALAPLVSKVLCLIFGLLVFVCFYLVIGLELLAEFVWESWLVSH